MIFLTGTKDTVAFCQSKWSPEHCEISCKRRSRCQFCQARKSRSTLASLIPSLPCVFLFKAARPALNAASSQGHYEVVEYLLDCGASVNAIDGVSYSTHNNIL